MDTLLAYDVGTSGTKAVLMTTTGQILATAYEPHPTRYPRPLWAEQDPEDWWRTVAASTRDVLDSARADSTRIRAISFTTQMVNLIPVDGSGKPLTGCISWLDGRAGDEANAVMRRLGGRRLFAALVGATLTGKDVLPKMLWLRRHQPGVFNQAAHLIDCSSYLLHRATGRLVVDWSVASVTGLFNLKSKTWDHSLMRFFRIPPEKFPKLVQSTDQVGGLTAEAASFLGLPPDLPVFAGCGDGQAAPVGAGAVGDGDGHLVLGTSGFVGVITRRRVVGKQGIVTLQSADPAKLLLIGEMETAAACLRWAAENLYGAAPSPKIYQRMDQEVLASAPGARNLIFTPWMYGERAPVADERLRASFVNLGVNHTRADMTRAIYEGVAYNLRWMLDTIWDLFGFPLESLRVIGGGAKSPAWCQILADVTGRRLEVMPSPQEASAVGAGLLAAVGLGLHPSIESLRDLMQPERTITPNPETPGVYQTSYEVFRHIHKALRPVHHRMNTMA